MTDWRPSCSVETLRERGLLLATVRRFFEDHGVLEVQTPVLGRSTVTDPAIDSVSTDAGQYLQTSPEYHMKRLLAADAPSIYQIGPVFRAGEAGRWHNPEFTMVEWYRLGFDANALMTEVALLVDALLGPASYETHRCADLVRARFGIDIDDRWAIVEFGRAHGLAEPRPDEALDLALAEALRSLECRRVFVTEFPAAMAALARLGANGYAARFELVIDGLEVANGYHELTDAELLAERFATDVRTRGVRRLRGVEPDQRLLAAQRHGLPDCAGVAMGFDRLLALKLGAAAVTDVMAFDWDRA